MCICLSITNLILQNYHNSSDKASVLKKNFPNACFLNIKLTFH